MAGFGGIREVEVEYMIEQADSVVGFELDPWMTGDDELP